jgi:ADP-ribosylglycohydrolase
MKCFFQESSPMSTTTLPTDHDARMERARLALEGLSIGDAFGGKIFNPDLADSLHRPRPLPPPPWRYSDDTVMAMGIVEVLQQHGHIDQDDLVRVFERRYWADVNRGYGPNIHEIFRALRRGVPWRTAATAPPIGHGSRSLLGRLAAWLGLGPATPSEQYHGSLGNGGAMRAAPVGGYFADDVAAVVAEASASAEVTHAHPDGMAGAVAVAVAAAWAWRCHAGLHKHTPEGLLDHVLEHTPDGPTRARLVRARALPADTTAKQAGRELGNGCPITSAETVPFTIWCVARHLDDYVEAVWTAVSVGGDMDTIGAIVGGIVALGTGRGSIPKEWLESREALDNRLPFRADS